MLLELTFGVWSFEHALINALLERKSQEKVAFSVTRKQSDLVVGDISQLVDRIKHAMISMAHMNYLPSSPGT